MTLIISLSVSVISMVSALSLGLFQERGKRDILIAQIEVNRSIISQKDAEIAQARTSGDNVLARELRDEIRQDNRELRLYVAEQRKRIEEQDRQICEIRNAPKK